MLLGLPGNPLPLTQDQLAALAVAKMPVKSVGRSLAKGERGIILPSPLQIHQYTEIRSPGERRQTMSTPRPKPLDLRQSLLFWDVIQLPEELWPMYGDDLDVAFLDGCGLVKKYVGPSDEALAAPFKDGIHFVQTYGLRAVYDQLRLNLFTTLENKEPGQWAMGRGVQSPDIPTGARVAGRGALIELTKMLPVPDGDVHLEDILAFKDRRRDELLALRSYMSGLFASVAAGDVDEMVKANRLEEFERSVEAYQTVLAESRLKAVLCDLAAGLNIAGPVSTALQALTGASGFVPLALLALGGAINVTPLGGFRGRKTNEAFEYIGRYHTEVPWQKQER